MSERAREQERDGGETVEDGPSLLFRGREQTRIQSGTTFFRTVVASRRWWWFGVVELGPFLKEVSRYELFLLLLLLLFLLLLLLPHLSL